MKGLSRPVYYRNEQWAVTSFGIECLERGYPIEACRLGDCWGDRAEGLPDWPLHLSQKGWVKDELFMQAFLIALGVHAGRYRQLFKTKWFRETRAWIKQDRKQSRLFDKALDIVAPPDPVDGFKSYTEADFQAADELIAAGKVS